MSKQALGPLHIAIDGPVSAGKGTVARGLAERLSIPYIDTGAMYRAAAYLAQTSGISLEDVASVVRLVSEAKIEIRQPTSEERDGRLSTIILNGEDISWKIRSEEVGFGASVVSQHPQVRAILVAKQQEMARDRSVVMEGRDITTRVLPKAVVRIFLTASAEERAHRRQRQLKERGIIVPYEKVLSDLLARDRLDSTREVDPLRVTKGVWVLDTTDLTVPEVLEKIVKYIQKKGF